MKLVFLCSFFFCFLTGCQGQKTFGEERLKLIKEISLPGIKGRIDHMAFNPKEQILYVAALGNNSVEVIDLKIGATIHSIKEVEEPQGIAYLARQNEIAVASGGSGDCIFYNASSFQKLAVVHLHSDADNVRYDEEQNK